MVTILSQRSKTRNVVNSVDFFVTHIVRDFTVVLEG